MSTSVVALLRIVIVAFESQLSILRLILERIESNSSPEIKLCELHPSVLTTVSSSVLPSKKLTKEEKLSKRVRARRFVNENFPKVK